MTVERKEIKLENLLNVSVKMTGVLLIVNIPQKNHEADIRREEKTHKIVIEKEKYENATKIINELKENKKFSSLRSSVDSSVQNDGIACSTIAKCKSTDCLNVNDVGIELHKSKSENAISEKVNSERKKYLKSPWDDIKQVIKLKRNKITITRPGRAVDILSAFHWDTPLETILSEIVAALDLQNVAWTATRDNKFWQVSFSLKSNNLCEELLQVLRTFGIGSRYHSSLGVIPCALYYQTCNKEELQLRRKDNHVFKNTADTSWSHFSSSIRERTNLAQVLHSVRSNAALTFDWLFLMVVAALIAAIGLVDNSTVILVASVLISPLMAPITAGTLGTVVHDRSLQYMGVIHEMFGLFLCLMIGFLFGLAVCAAGEQYGNGEWPTEAMLTRASLRSLWMGVLVAVPSGAAAALAVLGGRTASLVGVAISVALLPPAVNAGLFWSLALVNFIYIGDDSNWALVRTSYYSDNFVTELAILGTVSLCLTLVNIICIFFTGIAVYKVKKVYPLHRRDIAWWRANRNLLEVSGNNSDAEKTTWDDYSKWCNEAETKQGMQTNETNLGEIQKDSVTFRRHPNTRRQRSQNIESYCIHKERLGESYMPLEVDTTKYKLGANSTEDNQNSEDSPNSTENIGINYANRIDSSLEFDTKYSFYNLAFQDLHTDNKSTEETETVYPTIEPSLNYTVESKRHGLILDRKSFHV